MTQFLRPSIRAMAGYTPGEQPQSEGFVKLNTNENPYPPSPRVLAAIAECLQGDRLRKYPDPMGTAFRQVAGRLFDVDPDAILIGNGSDDILTIVTRAFVPEGGLVVAPSPSYLLYRSLAEIQGARFQDVPFTADWLFPPPWPLPKANLTFVANPNSPTGTSIPATALEALAAELAGPLVVDEAYVDFAETSALALARLSNVIVARTLSKSYSLAGLRFGFAIAAPPLVRELVKVKDSYNCDMLSLAGATAALEDQAHMEATRTKIRQTRARLSAALGRLGFQVLPSQANFVWATRSDRPVRAIFEELKLRRILVRYMNYAGHGDGLRITVGTDTEVDRLLEVLEKLVPAIHSAPRTAEIRRETGETKIALALNLDGTGQSQLATGIGFFDHMLNLLARHSLIDLRIEAHGDLHVDAHHTVEDVGICLGKARAQALGDKAGIRRYGSVTLPMDEALVTVAIDLSGRAFCVWQAELQPELLGTFNTALAEEFWRGVAGSGAFNLHVLCHHGRNAHHVIEAIFKAAARALRQAVEFDPRGGGIPSTKGVL